MDSSVLQFYDRLSVDYHLLFEDWPTTVRRQAEVLDRLLRDQIGGPPASVLDCCCGIGTQAIGLALRGYRVQGTDLSAEAIGRAGREAAAFGVTIPFGVADVRTLAEQVDGTFDAVLACDNALPHLLTDEDLHKGVGGMAAKLRPSGIFLASTRDYDALVRDRPRATSPRVFEDPSGHRVVFQVWDWTEDGRGYRVNQFVLKESDTGWQTSHYATRYRALLREEFTQTLRLAGLAEVRWHMPEESGYYQPVVTARKPG
jgi:2-polyprenyl-3-methyl-5-hydroxy-6-metoxy-1,4-benzoquinol methylase